MLCLSQGFLQLRGGFIGSGQQLLCPTFAPVSVRANSGAASGVLRGQVPQAVGEVWGVKRAILPRGCIALRRAEILLATHMPAYSLLWFFFSCSSPLCRLAARDRHPRASHIQLPGPPLCPSCTRWKQLGLEQFLITSTPIETVAMAATWRQEEPAPVVRRVGYALTVTLRWEWCQERQIRGPGFWRR